MKDNKEKAYPSSKEAEEAVLGACLLDGESIVSKVSSWIRQSDAFHFNDNRRLWECLYNMYKSHEKIDTLTVHEKMKEQFDKVDSYWITGLAEVVPTVANVEQYAKIIWEKHIQREIGKSSYKLFKHSFGNYEQTSNLLDSHSRLVDELSQLAPNQSVDSEILIDSAVDAMLTGSNVIPFGFWALDKPAGGMTKKEITVLGGRPGHGKTTLMINVLAGLASQGLKVMIFNREMSNEEMWKKIFVMESNKIIYEDLRKKSVNKDCKEEIEKMVQDVKHKYHNIYTYDTIRDLDDTMREISKVRPDVVIDDYIQLIRVRNGNKDRRFQIEEIMQEYKWAAKKWEFSGFLVSQLNREIEKRIDPYPRMSDYSESGVIEQTAETAMFVFYGHNFDSEGYDEYESQIITAKARYGRVGNYIVGFNGDGCKFFSNSVDARRDAQDRKDRKNGTGNMQDVQK
jgi:replicative DNA helicase